MAISLGQLAGVEILVLKIPVVIFLINLEVAYC